MHFLLYAIDIDECDITAHNCSSDASCSNSAGSFECTCNQGYTGDGIACSGENFKSLKV